MESGHINIIPGGMNTDVVENLLSGTEFQLIKNMRMQKKGEWINDNAWVELITGLSGVKSGIEITDDLSGDRFILYHSGTALNRIDFDDGDGNGYENETPAGVNLPSGVTISADDNLRYFFYNGVVRITGATHVMRYEYVDRSLMPECTTLVFYSPSGSAMNASDATLDTNGHGPDSKSGTEITQTDTDGKVKDEITVTSGRVCVVKAWVSHEYGVSIFKIGSTDGANDYGEVSSAVTGTWEFIEVEFTATGTDVFIEYNPSSGESTKVGIICYVSLREKRPLVTQDWILTKAEISTVNNITYAHVMHVLNGATYRAIEIKVFLIYDGGQYSLLGNIEKDSSGFRDIKTNANYISLLLQIPETVFSNNERIIGLCVVGSVSEVSDDETTKTKYLYETIDFENEIADYTYSNANMYWLAASPERLYLSTAGSDVFPLGNGLLVTGNRVTITNENGSATGEIIEVDETDDTDPDNPDEHITYFGIDGPIGGLLSGGANQNLPITSLTIERKTFEGYFRAIDGDSLNISVANRMVWAILDLTAGTDFYDFTGLPEGVSKIFYNYSHFGVMDNQAFVLSSETDEGDLIRWSPPYQLDVFPSTFYGQTEIGDRDENRALGIRDGRAFILKKKSLSQVQVVNGRISEDVGIQARGLYAENFYTVIDHLLYFGDENDIYIFNGNVVTPFLMPANVRQYYRDNKNSSSVLLYNKLLNEFWAVLNGVILVYQFDYDVWVVLDYSTGHPLNGFMDFDNQLIGIIATGFINYNHSSGTFGEAVQSYFKARVTDLRTPGQYKKVFEELLYCECSSDVTVTLTDNIEATSKVQTFTPNATKETVIRKYPSYMFREFECELQTESSATLDFVFRSLKIGVIKWR